MLSQPRTILESSQIGISSLSYQLPEELIRVKFDDAGCSKRRAMDLLRILGLLLVILDTFVELKLPAVPCAKIKLKFGRVKYMQRGRFAKFLCNVGYTLYGERFSTCVRGEWDLPPPKCVRPTCYKVKPPANGLYYPSHGGAVLNFFCKNNYQLRGPSETYCDGRRWDSALPTCLPSNTTPSMSCDFEHEDICGWNHDLNHDFDWRRMHFNTPSGSIGTGPSHDHTKGEGKDGYYMYIESSSRNENDTARLISPIYNKTQEDTCFEFFYHMYGSTTGTLRVYLKKYRDDWTALAPETAIFNKKGNQGDRWYRAFVNLGAIDDDYQIVFEGVRGPGFISDIAIDDVSIMDPCNTDEAEISTTELADYSSDPPMMTESCVGRCNFHIQSAPPEAFMISCDCDDECPLRNRCCPDFFDICIYTYLQSIVGGFTDEAITDTSSTMETTDAATMSTSLSKIESTVTRPTTITSTTAVAVRNITIPLYTRLPLVILTRPTTAKIVEKTNIKYVKPVKDLSNDVVELPPNPVSSDYGDETPAPPPKESPVLAGAGDLGTFKERVVVDNEDVPQSHVMRTTVFAVGVVFGVLLGLVGMAFAIKRYRLCARKTTYGNAKYSSASKRDSDVIFLTSDEHLDLGLPQDYDSS